MNGDRACCAPGRDHPAGPGAGGGQLIDTDPRAATPPAKQTIALPGGYFDMGSENADINPGDSEGP